MIIKIAVLAVTGAFLTAYLKNLKPEYGQVCLLAMGVFLIFIACTYLEEIKNLIHQLNGYLTIQSGYVIILMKITGIAYVCEFASNLCKDAGCRTIASQVELIGKLSMLLLSTPVISSLIETVEELF